MSDYNHKWLIAKCRRGRRWWHVTGPNVSTDPDFPFCEEYEFRTGEKAIEFVVSRLKHGPPSGEGETDD